MDTEGMRWVLREFKAALPEAEEAWVVLDRVSPKVEVPEGIRRVFLPPYSPELQPVERVWPWVNEAVANRWFPSLEALVETVAQRCLILQKGPQTLRRHTLFHGWPGVKDIT